MESGLALQKGERTFTAAVRTELDIQLLHVRLDASRRTVLDVEQSDIDLTFGPLPF